jgi:hypothetical protein
MAIYNQDRLKKVKDFRGGDVVAPTDMNTATPGPVPLGPIAPPPVAAPSKPMGNTAFGDWMRSPERGNSEFARFMRGGEKLGDRPAIVPQKPQYTAPIGTPAPASSLGTLGMAPVVTMPEPAIQGPTIANAANLPPVIGPRPMSDFVAKQVDQSLPQVSALPPAPKADLSTGTMAIQPGRLAAQDRGVFVGGVKQAPAMPGTDPQALEAWHNQNLDKVGMQAAFPETTPNMGYVGQASSNVPGTRAINMGGMATTEEALAALAAPGKQQAPAWDQAGIDAAKNDPARQVAFKPGVRPEQGKPFFVRAPSREERVAGIAGANAERLAGIAGRTAVDVAKQGTVTAVEQARAGEAEKTRRSGEVLEGKKIDAKGRVDAAKETGTLRNEGIAMKPETANKYNTPDPATVQASVRSIKEYDQIIAKGRPTVFTGDYDNAVAKREAEVAGLNAVGLDEKGRTIEAATSGNQPEKVLTPEIAKQFIEKNGGDRLKARNAAKAAGYAIPVSM